MAEESVYQVVLKIVCTACGQTLNATTSVDGVIYSHDNPEDCSQPPLSLPPIMPEQVASLFVAPAKAPSKPKTKARKAATKKKR